MKNKIKTLLIASMCMAMAVTSVPVDLNLFNKTTVEAATGKNGLYHEGNDWNYYVDDNIAVVTTLVKYNGSWWYVSGGKVNFGATGLCKYNGTWWYVKNGKVSFTTTLCKYNGIWWYINNGAVNFNKTTLVKYGSNWYAVAKGQVAWKYTGKLAYNGRYFNVVNGVVKF